MLGTERTRPTDKRTFNLLSVYANGRAINQLSQPIGWCSMLGWTLSNSTLQENETGSEHSNDVDLPQVVDRVCGNESDDDAL